MGRGNSFDRFNVRNFCTLAEGIAAVSRWTLTYGQVVAYAALGVKPTRSLARTNTFLVDTGLCFGAFVVDYTLGSTVGRCTFVARVA